MSPTRRRAYIGLLIIAVIWGFSASIIKYTLYGFSTNIFLTYRFFISSLVAIIIFMVTGVKIPKNPKILAITLLNGFFISTVALGLLFLGTAKTTSMDANLISAMSPIIIAVAGVFLLKEHITKKESIGMLIASSGTLITVIGPVLKLNNGFGGLEGNLLVLASVIVGAGTAIIAKVILRNQVEAVFATNTSFIVGFLTILPFSISEIIKTKFSVITSVPLGYHLGVFYMALISGTLAYYLWHKAEKTIEVGEVNLIAYLYPIFGAPLSILWLKEKIDIFFIIGSILIAFGVILAELKRKKQVA